MNNSREFLIDLLALSLCAWGIFALYSILRIKSLIVRRYEIETNLSKLLYFSYYMPLAKYLPDFFSSGLYAFHLLSFVWFWKVIKFIKEKRPQVGYFDDIDTPEEVTKYFTTKEIRLVKRPVIACFIIFFHAIAYYILRCLWPDVFN